MYKNFAEIHSYFDHIILTNALCTVVALSTLISAASANLIFNPSFETATTDVGSGIGDVVAFDTDGNARDGDTVACKSIMVPKQVSKREQFTQFVISDLIPDGADFVMTVYAIQSFGGVIDPQVS